MNDLNVHAAVSMTDVGVHGFLAVCRCSSRVCRNFCRVDLECESKELCGAGILQLFVMSISFKLIYVTQIFVDHIYLPLSNSTKCNILGKS